MFTQLFSIRLKAAEKALREGRWDEAYRLAIAPDLKEHKRAKAVLGELAAPFLERARVHFRADRFGEALADLERAAAGGNLAEQVAELRAHVMTVANEVQRAATARRGEVDAARRRIERGSLEAGKRILDQAAGQPAVEDLRLDAARRATEVDDLLRQASSALDAGQWPRAVERLQRARSLDAHHDNVIRLETRLCEAVLGNAREAMKAGRVRCAAEELKSLRSLGDGLAAKRELIDALNAFRESHRALAAHQYADAKRHALTLARLEPDAGWVQEVVRQLESLEDLFTGLVAGPLGDAMNVSPPAKVPAVPRVPAVAAIRNFEETVALPYGSQVGTARMPNRLLLLVDGGGSYLLLRNERISIGRSACDDPADVPLLSDLSARHAHLQRVDDDFFLFSTRDAEVGGRMVRQHLMRDGDRVVLGPRAKFVFRMPSRRSASAVLDLSDTTRMPQDVRRVVLLAQHATLGNSAKAHVVCRAAGTDLVIFERDGGLWVRRRSNLGEVGDVAALALGQPVEIDGVGLTLEHWRPQPTNPPGV